ncbi:MAG: hypothetical protein NT129_01380 [Candidatus Aenigmarchaeota archaeon]|nr:hypothetical protein [Candidatus Aenigmarchaeota archaeon]
MKIKDKVVSWYVKNILIPKLEEIDNPGYVIAKFTELKFDINLRELFLPENLFIIFEKKIIDDHGTEGKNILYKIGKSFSYIDASVSHFPTIKTLGRKEFLEFAYNFSKYVEGTLAEELSQEIEYDNKILKIKMKGYVICSKNGLGQLLSMGGQSGIWAWVVQDSTVEAVKLQCQGRGDKECKVIVAPYDTLVKMGYKPIKCTDLETIELGKEYEDFNKIRPTVWARNSLRSLIDSGFFNYAHGQVTYKDERFFLVEASFMYILERELKKIEDGLKVLWDVSFDFGKMLAEISGKQDPCKFIMDFFPALGFGDILAVTKKGQYEIIVNYFPWLEWYKDIDFVMFRGMLSGVISGFIGKTVELNKIDKDLSGGYLSLHITEG